METTKSLPTGKASSKHRLRGSTLPTRRHPRISWICCGLIEPMLSFRATPRFTSDDDFLSQVYSPGSLPQISPRISCAYRAGISKQSSNPTVFTSGFHSQNSPMFPSDYSAGLNTRQINRTRLGRHKYMRRQTRSRNNIIQDGTNGSQEPKSRTRGPSLRGTRRRTIVSHPCSPRATGFQASWINGHTAQQVPGNRPVHRKIQGLTPETQGFRSKNNEMGTPRILGSRPTRCINHHLSV